MKKLLLLLSVLGACSDQIEYVEPTQVMVRVDTLTPNIAFEKLSVEVFRQEDGAWTRASGTDVLRANVEWPVDVAVIPAPGSSRSHLFEVVVQLVDAGKVIAKQRKLTNFVPRQQRVLNFDLWTTSCGGAGPVCEPREDCHGADCTTCIAGACTPAPNERDLPPLVLDASRTTPRDAAASDATVVDASEDAAIVDASKVDAAIVDAAVVDASLVDASMVDAQVDAGPVCAGALDTLVQGACVTRGWLPSETLSNHDKATYPSVAMDQAGDALVVYHQSAPYSVQARRLSGRTWAPEEQVRGGDGDWGFAVITPGPGRSTPWVVGRGRDPSNFVVWGARFETSWDSRVIESYRINDIMGWNTGFAGSAGGAAALVARPTLAFPSGLVAFSGNSDGSWTASSAWPNAAGGERAYISHAVGATGIVVAAWADYESTAIGARFSIYTSRVVQGTWETPLLLGTSLYSNTGDTRVVIDASGVAHVFWIGDNILRHSRRAADGTLLGTSDVPTSGNMVKRGWLDVATNGTRVAVSWKGGSGDAVLGVNVWAAESGWGSDKLARAAGSTSGGGKLSMASDGRLLAVWSQNDQGSVYWSRSDPGNTSWSIPEILGSTGSSSDAPVLAGAPNGRALAVWSQSNADETIWLQARLLD